jgi:hypothetical protein
MKQLMISVCSLLVFALNLSQARAGDDAKSPFFVDLTCSRESLSESPEGVGRGQTFYPTETLSPKGKTSFLFAGYSREGLMAVLEKVSATNDGSDITFKLGLSRVDNYSDLDYWPEKKVKHKDFSGVTATSLEIRVHEDRPMTFGYVDPMSGEFYNWVNRKVPPALRLQYFYKPGWLSKVTETVTCKLEFRNKDGVVLTSASGQE